MNTEEAKLCLSFHSGRNADIDNPRWKNGFLGSLRPYSGNLHEDSFHEIMRALRALSQEFAMDTIDKNPVADIMSIIHLGRAWGVYDEGMLKSSCLISENDSQKLEKWIEIISCTFTMLLETDGDEEAAFEEYHFYLEDE